MAPPNAKLQPKKRLRKRKRRVASSSSSSSDSDSDSPSSSGLSVPVVTRKVPVKPKVSELPQENSESEEDSSSSEEESALSRAASPAPAAVDEGTSAVLEARRRERSPSPPPTTNSVPAFLSPGDPSQNEAALRARFKKFWMASVADAFKSDLEEIQKEPTMTKSRLAILIDSLASGADVYTSSSKLAASQDGQINEMEVVLGNE